MKAGVGSLQATRAEESLNQRPGEGYRLLVNVSVAPAIALGLFATNTQGGRTVYSDVSRRHGVSVPGR